MKKIDRYNHLVDLKEPIIDKNFSFVISASDTPDKFDNIKDSIKNVKIQVYKIEKKIEDVEINMVKKFDGYFHKIKSKSQTGVDEQFNKLQTEFTGLKALIAALINNEGSL